MKLAFTLLHYNNIEVTCKSISFLLQLEYADQIELVVVDNASPNGSGKILKDDYRDKANVHIILNEKNDGFACGNNIGYRYAKEVLGCDTIVVMNNDVFIEDQSFIRKLLDVSDVEADIIAPNIIGRKGPQNPFRIRRVTTLEAAVLLTYNTCIHMIYHIPWVNVILANVLDQKEKCKPIHEDSCFEDMGACIPHGACVIFLPSWVMNEEFAFPPITFMFFEEDVLAEYMHIKGYLAVLIKKLVVHHVEDASTDYDKNNSVEKRLFVAKQKSRSIRKMLAFRFQKRLF